MGIAKRSSVLVVALRISCKTTGVRLEEESLSSGRSVAVTELQSGCRSLRMGRRRPQSHKTVWVAWWEGIYYTAPSSQL